MDLRLAAPSATRASNDDRYSLRGGGCHSTESSLTGAGGDEGGEERGDDEGEGEEGRALAARRRRTNSSLSEVRPSRLFPSGPLSVSILPDCIALGTSTLSEG